MKFGNYLVDKERSSWAGKYLDYAGLKELIKSASREHEAQGSFDVYSPRTASLTVLRGENRRDSAEELFFRKLEDEVDKIGGFTSSQVQSLRSRLYDLQQRIVAAGLHQAGHGEGSDGSSDKAKLQEELLEEAKDIGDEFLQLEKYVNLNYMGFHKILKKHDKQLPHSPCRQFYISHLHNQPWVQGSYADLLVTLGHVYADIRGDEELGSNGMGAVGGADASGMVGLSPRAASRSMSPANLLGSGPHISRQNTASVGGRAWPRRRLLCY